MGGMAEVELGNLAQQNAQNDEVKQFGARMVQDHTAANQQLMPIRPPRTSRRPRSSTRSTEGRMDKLSKMRGAEFDRAYMREMVEDHDKDVKKFRQEAEHGNDADLKSVRAENAAGARAAPEDGARHQQVADRGRLIRSATRATAESRCSRKIWRPKRTQTKTKRHDNDKFSFVAL